MFRKAQQSVAHQSTLPSGFTLGNRDLRSLQEIINTEKDFIKSNTKSAQDFHKTSEAIKQWSAQEGEDLHDVLGKLSLLLDSYATAQSRFNGHLSTIRQHYKSIRTREESLAELRARKRTLGGKIDSVEKKLAKMGPENKELMKTTAQLKELRGEMESLRVEVQAEEAAMGDFKRRTSKEAMGIKCAGLMEFAEKIMIVAETGKLMIEEIPLEPTHPGMPRADYVGSMRIDQLLQEATRGIADVGFAPVGVSASTSRNGYNHGQLQNSEMYDSTHDYYNNNNSGTADDVPDEANGAGWEEERRDSLPEDVHHIDEQGHQPTPIYAQHASSGGSHAPSLPQDSAAEEWRKSKIPIMQEATSSRDSHPKPNSSTPIADQFASRSPQDYQLGGTGLHLVSNGSNDSVDKVNAPASPIALPSNITQATTAGPSIRQALQTPQAPAAVAAPAPNTTVQVATPTNAYGTTPHLSDEIDDQSYFQSVGSTRAAQQSVRRPLSPSNAMGPGTPGLQSHIPPSGPYEPQAEGRKMTAATFRKGFGRMTSSQQMGASTTSLGSSAAAQHPPIDGTNNDTAPLAIRKRISAVPGQTGADGAVYGHDDQPAPPYNAHQSVYGGLGDDEDYLPPQPPVAPWGSRPNSRPSSAAGYRY